MPELPEVEATRRTLGDALLGTQVQRVRVGKPLRWPLGVAPTQLVGAQVGAIERRGKYLWLPLQKGVSSATVGGGLLMHLGMSGALTWHAQAKAEAHPAPGPHDHFDLWTNAGLMRLTDPRRFGAIVWSASREDDPARRLLANLGPEPFDPTLTAARFHAAVKAHRADIKSIVLSGKVMVGAGNIYACEALFDAGIDPRTPGVQMTAARSARLLEALQAVLACAIDVGGTTIRNYRNADGDQGRYQTMVRVYGREAEPCVTCGTPVKRIVQGQRSSFFCPTCQTRRARRARPTA